LVVLASTINKFGGKDMDAIGQATMFAENYVPYISGALEYVMMSSENPSGVISIPKIHGGVVTRMTVNPASGVISEIFIETSESSIAFPEEVRFDLDAKINIQRIIIVGGSGMDHQ
jgi:hypothetical protein